MHIHCHFNICTVVELVVILHACFTLYSAICCSSERKRLCKWFYRNKPSVEPSNLCIRHYSIIVREVNTGTQTQHTSTGLQTTINRLHPYYTYECRVAAYTTREGVLSRPINITTDQDGKHELAVSTNVHGVTILTSY